MNDRSKMIRTAAALPVGDADRRRILADLTLRSRTIRLAASLPVGSSARAELLRTVTAADEGDSDPVKDLEKSLGDSGVYAEDFGDLVTFVVGLPFDMSSQPDKVLPTNFKMWWGGSLPLPWRDIATKDLTKFIRATHDLIPLVIAAATSTPKKGKTAGFRRRAFGIVVIAAAVAAANHRQDEDAARESAKKRRDEKAKQDSAYKPPANFEPSASFFSYKEGKDITVKGKDLTGKLAEVAYGEYTWAAEKAGIKALDRDTWDESRKVKFTNDPDTKDSEIASMAKSYEVGSLARTVGEALKGGAKESDLKGIVEKKFASEAEDAKNRWNADRASFIKHELKGDDRNRLSEILSEERASTGGLEKFLGSFSADWADGKVKDRASKRQEKEQSDKSRTYADYVKARGKGGGKPMTKEEWENRYGK